MTKWQSVNTIGKPRRSSMKWISVITKHPHIMCVSYKELNASLWTGKILLISMPYLPKSLKYSISWYLHHQMRQIFNFIMVKTDCIYHAPFWRKSIFCKINWCFYSLSPHTILFLTYAGNHWIDNIIYSIAISFS